MVSTRPPKPEPQIIPSLTDWKCSGNFSFKKAAVLWMVDSVVMDMNSRVEGRENGLEGVYIRKRAVKEEGVVRLQKGQLAWAQPDFPISQSQLFYGLIFRFRPSMSQWYSSNA
jgi:hypothetical protein